MVHAVAALLVGRAACGGSCYFLGPGSGHLGRAEQKLHGVLGRAALVPSRSKDWAWDTSAYEAQVVDPLRAEAWGRPCTQDVGSFALSCASGAIRCGGSRSEASCDSHRFTVVVAGFCLGGRCAKGRAPCPQTEHVRRCGVGCFCSSACFSECSARFACVVGILAQGHRGRRAHGWRTKAYFLGVGNSAARLSSHQRPWRLASSGSRVVDDLRERTCMMWSEPPVRV